MSTKTEQPVSEVNYVSVNVFSDELEALGIEPSTQYKEAQTRLREVLGVLVPARRKTGKGGSVQAAARMFANATPEARERALAVLRED